LLVGVQDTAQQQFATRVDKFDNHAAV
jgi:hypothetical protein